MSYTPTDWKTGDVITAEKLNNMENGIENSGVLVAAITDNGSSYSCDKTSAEIKAAMDAGVPAYFKFIESDFETRYYLCNYATEEDGEVTVRAAEISMGNLASNSFIQQNVAIGVEQSGRVTIVTTRYTMTATQG